MKYSAGGRNSGYHRLSVDKRQGEHMGTKALASDIDGTLFFRRGHPDHRLHLMLRQDIKAVGALQASGGLFGVCTGRPICGVRRSLHNRLRLDFVIASSGAMIVDGGGRVIERHEISRDAANELLKLPEAQQGRPPFLSAGGDFLILGVPGKGLSHLPLKPLRRLEDLKDPLYSVSFEPGTEQDAHDLAENINETFGGALSAFQNRTCVDVVPAGCSKGQGVSAVRRHFGVDLMAGIGDSFNDLPLLEAADVSYTFHRSPAEVREKADVLVDDVAGAIDDFLSR